MSPHHDRWSLRLCLWLVRAFSVVVPRPWRADWRDEWEAEFRHRQTSLDRRTRLDWRSSMDLVRRAFGALPDAAWLRRQFTADAEVVHDLRHGVRMLRKSPTFTAAAVVTLALGIGGTVAIATLLDTLFFRALPYADAERIVTLWQRPPTGEREDVAPANFLDWRERSRSFEQVAAAIPYSYDYTGGGEPEVFFGAQVTEGFWDALGVRPALGRFFRPGEHARGGQPVAIITHSLWQRRFGGDPGIVNSAISLDGALMTVVGVLPADFKPQLLPRPGELSVWTPKVIQDHEKRVRGSAWWNVVARLRPGVSLDEAQAELDVDLGCSGTGISSDQRAADGPGRLAARAPDGRSEGAAAGDVRGRRSRPDDRLHQRRQPASRQGHAARARVCDSNGAWRGPRTPGATAGGRKPPAVSHCRNRWRRARCNG